MKQWLMIIVLVFVSQIALIGCDVPKSTIFKTVVDPIGNWETVYCKNGDIVHCFNPEKLEFNEAYKFWNYDYEVKFKGNDYWMIYRYDRKMLSNSDNNNNHESHCIGDLIDKDNNFWLEFHINGRRILAKGYCKEDCGYTIFNLKDGNDWNCVTNLQKPYIVEVK